MKFYNYLQKEINLKLNVINYKKIFLIMKILNKMNKLYKFND